MHSPSEPFNRVHYTILMHIITQTVTLMMIIRSQTSCFRIHTVKHTVSDTPLNWSMYTHHENVRAYHIHDKISTTDTDIAYGDVFYN